MYREMCRRVLWHFEAPTCTLCTLRLGWAVSARAVNVDSGCLLLFTTPATLAATSVASTRVALRQTWKRWKRVLRHIYRKAEAEHPFWVRPSRFLTNLFLMLLYYYDFYGCFVIIIIIIIITTVFFFFYFHSCSGTDSCWSLCRRELVFRVSEGRFLRDCRDFNMKFEICLYEHNLFTFYLSLFAILLFFSLFKRKKKSVAVRERLVFILSSFMVPICTILKVLILVYMQNIPVLQLKKTCYEDKNKKMTASHLYFLNIVLLLYYVLQSPKRKKKKTTTLK